MLAVPLGTFFKLLLSAIANTCMMQKQGAYRTVLAVVPGGSSGILEGLSQDGGREKL
jgi:hypothetical protein